SSEGNGPCSGTKNASPDGKQSKSFNAEENGPTNDQGNETSNYKENELLNAETNQCHIAGENEPSNPEENKFHSSESNVHGPDENESCSDEENKFHSSESNVHSSDENESCIDEENEFRDAQENGSWNDKENETFDAKGHEPCSVVQKEPCNNEMYEPCHGGESQAQKVEENKKVSSLLKESLTNISSNTNDEQSPAAKCALSNEGIELHKTQESEEIQAETGTEVNSMNGSAGLRVPTRADLENITEKEQCGFESSATSEMKNRTFQLSESELLFKNAEAVKDRITSRKNQ
ncbi:hypothetical protein AVEN_138724-1, partial [Araneus ventricosus]